MSSKPEPPITLLHLTDTHLFATPEPSLLGIKTSASLAAVLQHVAASSVQPDRVLATGDLAQDATPGAYAQFASLLAPLGLPVHCLPGNHDHPERLQAALGAACKPVIDCGAWRIIMLDTHLPGSDGGHLAAHQLDLLDEAARVEDGRHVLLALHHHPVPVQSKWLDTMQIDNASVLLEHLAALSQVRALVWGHVHQDYDAWHEWPGQAQRLPLRLLASPSTCFQFTPRSERFSLDTTPPGYRWIFLHPDGSVTTKVVYLPASPAQAGRPAQDSTGY